MKINEDNSVDIDMTLTSAACSLTDVIERQAQMVLGSFTDEVRINWVWLPPWGPESALRPMVVTSCGQSASTFRTHVADVDTNQANVAEVDTKLGQRRRCRHRSLPAGRIVGDLR